MAEKYYDLFLPYYKQGDDLDWALAAAAAKAKGVDTQKRDWRSGISRQDRDTADHAEAFLAHAEMLEHAAKTLRRAAGLAKERGLRIAAADTHCIQVVCDAAVGDALVEEKFLSRDPEIWDEVDNDGGPDDDDDDDDDDEDDED